MEALSVRAEGYQRPRDARVALIRCVDCGTYYETSARQARRIRSGENGRRCPMCRLLPEDGLYVQEEKEEYVRWWLEDSGLTRTQLGEIARAMYPSSARRSGPVLSPSRRQECEANNHSSPDHGVHVVVLGRPGTRRNGSTNT